MHVIHAHVHYISAFLYLKVYKCSKERDDNHFSIVTLCSLFLKHDAINTITGTLNPKSSVPLLELSVVAVHFCIEGLADADRF